MLEVTSSVCLEDVHYLAYGHFGWNPEHEMDVVLIMIDLKDLQFRMMGGNLLKRFAHVRKNSVVEDLATVLCAKDEMIDAMIDAVGLFLEDGFHDAILARRRRKDFIPRLTPGVLRRNYKYSHIQVKESILRADIERETQESVESTTCREA